MPFGKLEKFDNSIDKELSILFIQETKLFRKDFTLFSGLGSHHFVKQLGCGFKWLGLAALNLKESGCLTTFV